MNWITKVVNQHAEMESPTAFWYWAAAATISAVVKDNVWMDRGGAYKLFPNIYVMLHADSGLKKGPPVGLAKDIVRRVNSTRIISGRSSIQGILKELGTGETSPGGKVNTKSVGFIVASEFSSSLVNDPAAMTILTDLYDRHYNEGEWRSLLKMETFQLKDPTITMLVATNEAHFEDFVAKKDIQGGFIGRMFVIAESQVHRLNPLIQPLTNPPNRDELAEYPKEIAKAKGQFVALANTPAGNRYEEWYYDFYKTIKENRIRDETGTIQRFGDSVLKVAMILSLATDTSLIITEDQMNEAIEVCEKLIGNIRRTTMGKRGMADDAAKKALIVKELLEREGNQITRAMFLKKHIMNGFNAEELDLMMASFHDSGLIITKSIGNNIIYEMPEQEVKRMREYLAGGSK
jgi:hypothetical protein